MSNPHYLIIRFGVNGSTQKYCACLPRTHYLPKIRDTSRRRRPFRSRAAALPFAAPPPEQAAATSPEHAAATPPHRATTRAGRLPFPWPRRCAKLAVAPPHGPLPRCQSKPQRDGSWRHRRARAGRRPNDARSPAGGRWLEDHGRRPTGLLCGV